jgi:hypothetical protein
MTPHSTFQDTEDQVDHILGDEYAGGPGTNPDDVKFLDAKLKELLAS